MSKLLEKIRQEAGPTGQISFARYMELALYCPEYGYYEAETDRIGRRGDFYTSVSVGPLFGHLLGFAFADGAPIRPGRATGGRPLLELIEAGAHDGQLALDILSWFRDQRPELGQSLRYWLLEPSPRRRKIQQARLAEFADRTAWLGELSELPRPGGSPEAFRFIFSNELLDAMPVHRMGWDALSKRWFEWGVQLDPEPAWIRLAAPWFRPAAEWNDPELLRALPDGFVAEICPAAEEWWRRAARALGPAGKLLTFDYGLTWEERWNPARAGGTLRAYTRHSATADVLSAPGTKDLTAHVNFSALEAVGQAAGMATEHLENQSAFLTRIAARAWRPESGFGVWTARETRQFQTLTHPEHLGCRFRVLVQSPALAGIAVRS